jgi:hypothetical protein
VSVPAYRICAGQGLAVARISDLVRPVRAGMFDTCLTPTGRQRPLGASGFAHYDETSDRTVRAFRVAPETWALPPSLRSFGLESPNPVLSCSSR